MPRPVSLVKTCLIAAAVAIGWGGTVALPTNGNNTGVPVVGVASAVAQVRGEVRRTARRTARRTTRRQNYYNALPGGCVRRGAYYYCGGVYYQPIVQNGATVYIIVNP